MGKMFGLGLVMILLVGFAFVGAESFSWEVESVATNVFGVYSVITVTNPDGFGNYYLSGDAACEGYGFDGCEIVELAEVATHSNGWDTFDVACDYLFGDGRHARPILRVRCFNESAQELGSDDFGIDEIFVEDEVVNFGEFDVDFGAYDGDLFDVVHYLKDGSDFVLTWFSDSWVDATFDSSASIFGCLDLTLDGVCDFLDKDDDGYYEDEDCDDYDYYVNPGADEICDGVDNDCDGVVDEGCEVACSNDLDCGVPACVGSSNYCDAGDVYQDYYFYVCNNPSEAVSYCSSYVAPWLVQSCGYDCLFGSCVGEFVDDVPPMSVSNLSAEVGEDWVSWSWNNPDDVDFYLNLVYFDGVNVLNSSNEFYNASGLLAETDYGIEIFTMDNSSNVNWSGVSGVAMTLDEEEEEDDDDRKSRDRRYVDDGVDYNVVSDEVLVEDIEIFVLNDVYSDDVDFGWGLFFVGVLVVGVLILLGLIYFVVR